MTGSGRAIVEVFERAEISPVVVFITGAGVREEQADDESWRVPKIELVGNLQVLYQTEPAE